MISLRRAAAPALRWSAALVASGAMALAASADDARPTIQVYGGKSGSYRVAVQVFVDQIAPPSTTRASDLRVALNAALELSGVLLPIDQAAFLGESASKLPLGERRYDCADWTQSGADALVEGRVFEENSQVGIEFAVWDTARCQRMGMESLTKPRAEGQRLTRLVADRIVGIFTGIPGSASSELAFISNRSGAKELYVTDVAGMRVQRATNTSSIKMFPSWMPGADGIVYTALAQNRQAALFLIARGPSVRAGQLLTGLMPASPKYRGVFAPDGQSLALVTSMNGAAEILWVARDGTVKRRITQNGAIDIAPSFSPDGKQLVYVSDRSGSPQLYLTNLETGGERRLTFQGSYNTGPSWSPDGRWIAYETRLESQFDIWLIDPSGDSSVPLVQNPRSDETPVWSPDGRKLGFSSNRRGRYDIYAYDLGRQIETRITQGEGDNTGPAWSPFPSDLRGGS
jgi:TolB protein